MQLARTILKTFGVVLAAYLLVAQAALGGFAHAEPGAAATSGLSATLCLNGDNATESDHGSHRRGCCVMGCAHGVVAPAPDPAFVAFVYAPEARLRRPPTDDIPLRPLAAARSLTPPRAPPAIG